MVLFRMNKNHLNDFIVIAKDIQEYGFYVPSLHKIDIGKGINKMATLGQNAKEYVSPETKNIAELEKVSIELDLKNKVVNEGTPDQFNYNFIVVDEVEYRVPNVVLKQLKQLLEQKPEMKYFSVSKEGTGLNTSYLVIPAN